MRPGRKVGLHPAITEPTRLSVGPAVYWGILEPGEEHPEMLFANVAWLRLALVTLEPDVRDKIRVVRVLVQITEWTYAEPPT